MSLKYPNTKYVAFLRGINVDGNHKVPMADLRKELEKLKFKNVETILNSGNVIFDAPTDDLEKHETTISDRLEKTFGFSIPTILIKSDLINQLLESEPFKDIEITKETRLYISLLQKDVGHDLQLPWVNDDKSFKIISKTGNIVSSVLDLSITNTPKGMAALEKNFGKDITTRNWNTLKRIEKKLEV